MNIAYTIIEAPPGPIYAAQNHEGLVYIGLGDSGYKNLVAYARKISDQPRIVPSVVDATSQIEAYLAGKRRDFNLPLDIRGTDFQREVWRILQKIPYGQTKSYAEIAIELGRPNAARAVGGACGANPVPLVIPCHRVLASNGGLGGYGGGLEWKEWLLALEGARPVRD